MLHKIIWFGFSEGFLTVRKETIDVKKERMCSKPILPRVICVACTRRALWVPHHAATFLFSASVLRFGRKAPCSVMGLGGGALIHLLESMVSISIIQNSPFSIFMSAYIHADINSYLPSTLVPIQSYMSYLVVWMIPVLILWRAFHLASVSHFSATILVLF